MGKRETMKDKPYQHLATKGVDMSGPDAAQETQPTIEDLTEERDIGLAADYGSRFAAEVARVANTHGFVVEYVREMSQMYADGMGAVLFRVEGALLTGESPENGEFVGRIVRVISQERTGEIPPSLFKPVSPGDTLLLVVGNVRAGRWEIGRFKDIAEAPEGAVFYIRNAPYDSHTGAFKKIDLGAGRQFSPRPWARLNPRGLKTPA